MTQRNSTDDKKPLFAFGRPLDEKGAIIPTLIDTKRQGDHGCDPIGDGTYRMVPSGDIVTFEERCRRLAAYTKGNR